MVVAAAPQSSITISARELFDPYLTLFRLDNDWGFFAPTVAKGSQLRYVIGDADGLQHTFIPEREHSRLHPAALWFRDRYKAVIDDPESFGDAAAADFCRKHPELRPVSVTLIGIMQNEFFPGDRLDGKHPLDPEFVNEKTLKTVPCAAP